MGLSSETQLQVGETLNKIPQREKGYQTDQSLVSVAENKSCRDKICFAHI